MPTKKLKKELRPERRIIEAEEFDGLKRYPYFREQSPGWYALEGNCRYYGAPGKGYFAMIHETARNRIAIKTLNRILPPGKYAVFISSCGLFWSDRPNTVTLRFGDAVSKITWSQRSKGFKWIQGTSFELKKPASRIELEATQFGGKGYAQLYEPNTRTIAVDQIYITPDLSEKTGPSIEGFHLIHNDRIAPAKMFSKTGTNYRTVDINTTPLPFAKPETTPVILQSFDSRKNLWQNSSFELGGSDGWCTYSEKQDGIHIFAERDHIKGDAFHGRYYMKFPVNKRNMPYLSRVVVLPKDGTYTLSAYMRRGKAGNTAKIGIVPVPDRVFDYKLPAISAACVLSDDWQRAVGTGQLKAGPVVLVVYNSCDLDAVQLEAGDLASEYAPRAMVEASVSTPYPGNIMYSDKPVTLTAWAHNSGEKKTSAQLSYRIKDIRERVVAKKTIVIPVDVGETVSLPLVIEPKLNGIFSTLYSAHGTLNLPSPSSEGELIYSVLPPIPQHKPRHALGCHMEKIKAIQALMARMGHKWQLYCKLKIDWPTFLNPEKGIYKWDKAHKGLTMAGKSGMSTMPCLWPNRSSPHIADKSMSSREAYAKNRDVTRSIKIRGSKQFPNLNKWKQYCKEVALNLGDELPWWTIEDESELYFSPREFAEIIKATVEGFQESGKPMKSSISSKAEYIEELGQELGNDFKIEALGSSSYNYEYWEARKARYLQKRYQLPWFCFGVGSYPMPHFQHSAPWYKGLYGLTARTGREMVFLVLGQDARIIGHYTGRMWMRGKLENTDYPLMDYDGTPLTHGFTYSCIPLLLADAKPLKDIYLNKLGTVIFTFRQNGRLGASTWANNYPGADIHWKTCPLTWHNFTLPGAAGQVVVTDMYGNPRDDIIISGDNLIFDLGEEPVFIFNRSLPDSAFYEMLRNATAKPRDLEIGLAFLPNRKGGVDLGVRVHNTTKKKYSGLKLDANFPPNRMVTRTSWMLPDRNGSIPDIAPGKTVWGRIKTTATLDFPIENATFTAWLTDAHGKEYPMYDTCWMTVAPHLTPAIDGELTEWDAVQPAWMYYTYSWARFGRSFPQFVRNGEYFKYAWRIDARAAIFSGYDDKHLYLAIRCEDDDLVTTGNNTDMLEIKLSPEPGEKASARTLKLIFKNGKPTLLADDSNNPMLDGIKMAWRQKKITGHFVKKQQITAWSVEVAIPLVWLGKVDVREGNAIGFDIVWHDADYEGEDVVAGTWRWAGNSTNLGTLFFGKTTKI